MLIHMPRAKHPSKTDQTAFVFIKSWINQLIKFTFYLYNVKYCFYAPKDVAPPFDKADEYLTGWKPEIPVTGKKNMWIAYLSWATLEVAALC